MKQKFQKCSIYQTFFKLNTATLYILIVYNRIDITSNYFYKIKVHTTVP